MDTDEPLLAAARYRALGARAVAVTGGADRLLLDDGSGPVFHPVPVNAAPVDATGAGDCFTGTVTARLALGDTLADAVSYGLAAPPCPCPAEAAPDASPPSPRRRPWPRPPGRARSD